MDVRRSFIVENTYDIEIFRCQRPAIWPYLAKKTFCESDVVSYDAAGGIIEPEALDLSVMEYSDL